MEANKVYLQPMGTILDAINDIIELQNGKLTFSDTPHGRVHFLVRMYANKWEFRFTVTGTSKDKTNVVIGIEQETKGSENLIKREFALLDSLLAVEAPIVNMKNQATL